MACGGVALRHTQMIRKMAADRVVALGALAVLVLELEEAELEDEEEERRKVWSRQWLKRRHDDGHQNTMFKLQQELELEDLAEYRKMCRMPPEIFGELVERLRPYIQRQNTNYRAAITVEERLSITLRHLALGDCFFSLAQQYRVGRCTVGRIVVETARALYDCLKDEYVKTPKTVEEWEDTANVFGYRWDLPHTIGAIDGKHIRIVAPPKSGSLYFNYHDYFSIVLLAITNANYEFIYVDVGAEGRTGDAGLWQETPFHTAMREGELNLPKPSTFVGVEGEIPYFLVGDSAFPLSYDLLKPYAQTDLEVRAQIFNYRLSRARRVVENTFGIMATRFRLFHQCITVLPDNATSLVLGCVALHNLLRSRCGSAYVTKGLVDAQGPDGKFIKGSWRYDPRITSLAALKPTTERNSSNYAKMIRNQMADYFLTREGAIPSQYGNVHV